MGWLAYRLTGSPLLLGVLAAAGQLPSLLLMPIAGGLSDRWSRHRILVVTQSLAMALTLVLAGLALAGVVAVWHLVAIGALLGVVGALDVPARQAFVADIVESRDDVGNAVALHASVTNAARLIGPSIGGAIVAHAGEGVCFLVNGASYAAVLLALGAMRAAPEAPPRTATPILRGLHETARYARSTRPIAAILMLVALVTLLGRPYTVLLPVFASEVLHGGPETLGWLMAASGCGALVGTLVLSGQRSLGQSAATITVGAAVAGSALALFALSDALWLSLALLFVTGRPARGRHGPLHDGVRRSRPGRYPAGGDARGEPRHRAHGAAGRARLPRGIARVRPPVPWTPSVGVSAVRAPAWPARSSSGGSLPRGSASPGLGGGRRGPLRLVGYAFCWIAVSTRSAVSGALRTRAPVAAKIAFESAGRIVVVPGSPRPVGYSVDGTTCTSTSGTSLILNTW